MGKALMFVIASFVLVAKVLAQTCPCSFEENRECIAIMLDPLTSTCYELLVPCPCYCDYSGANNYGDCLINVAVGYKFTDRPQCETVEIYIPICDNGPPPTPGGGPETPIPTSEPSPTALASPSTAPTYKPTPTVAPTSSAAPVTPEPTPTSVESHYYQCTTDITICGEGVIQCMLPPLPCKTILQTQLVYWQSVIYDVTIGFAAGWNDLKIDLQVDNEPDTSGWIVGNMPGTNVLHEDIVQGPAVMVESFYANESFSVYGAPSYGQILMQNCIGNGNQITEFPIYITYTNQSSGATFYDAPDFRGIRVITHIVVKVDASGDDI